MTVFSPEPIRRAVTLRGLGAALAMVLAGCASGGTFSGQIYRQGPIAYRVGVLPSGWSQSRSHGANLAFHHSQGGTVVVNADCSQQGEAPLDVLTNHLLFGVTAQQEVSRTPLTLDGREALRTNLTGQLDGVPIALALVVLKKNGCLYDFQLITGTEQFAAREPAFSAFVLGFTSEVGK